MRTLSLLINSDLQNEKEIISAIKLMIKQIDAFCKGLAL